MIEPLRIEFRLATPMKVGERPLHLDALLAYARIQQAIREGLDEEERMRYHDDLPLGKVGDSRQWVWQASALRIIPAEPPFIRIMTRRTDYGRLAQDRGKVVAMKTNAMRPGIGHMKNYILRPVFQWTRRVEAFCIGRKEDVIGLLGTITHLGGIRRNDWGRIAECRLEVDPVAERRWRERALPEELAQYRLAEHLATFGNCRPPYHDRTRWQNIFEVL